MPRLGNYYVVGAVTPSQPDDPQFIDVVPTLQRAKAAVVGEAHRQVEWIEPDVLDARGPLTWRAHSGGTEYRIALLTLQGEHIPRSAPADMLPLDLMSALSTPA